MPRTTSGSKRRRIFGIIALLILLLVIAGGYFSQRVAGAEINQPIDYSHRVHIEAGVQCLFCHSSAARSPVAGIPSVQKCMGCHAAIVTEGEAVEAVAGYWERGEPIPWERVNNQPDFVYFSHQSHLGAGLNCETCHGDVGEMEAAEPVVRMDMGWCLDCHEQQPEEKVPRLLDCLVCHK